MTAVHGAMLQMKWSTGEESTLVPGAGSVVVIPKVRRASGGTSGAGQGAKATKVPAKAKAKAPKKGASR